MNINNKTHDGLEDAENILSFSNDFHYFLVTKCSYC